MWYQSPGYPTVSAIFEQGHNIDVTGWAATRAIYGRTAHGSHLSEEI